MDLLLLFLFLICFAVNGETEDDKHLVFVFTPFFHTFQSHLPTLEVCISGENHRFTQNIRDW